MKKLPLRRRFTVADRSALDALRQWSDRADDRYFEIRCLAKKDAGHPWAVRVESETTSWSANEDAHESLARAVKFALQTARDAGFE